MTSVFELSTGIAGARHPTPHGQGESISRMINGLQGATLNIQFREKIYLYGGEAECVICAIKKYKSWGSSSSKGSRDFFSSNYAGWRHAWDAARFFCLFFSNSFPNCIAGQISNRLHIRRSFWRIGPLKEQNGVVKIFKRTKQGFPPVYARQHREILLIPRLEVTTEMYSDKLNSRIFITGIKMMKTKIRYASIWISRFIYNPQLYSIASVQCTRKSRTRREKKAKRSIKDAGISTTITFKKSSSL